MKPTRPQDPENPRRRAARTKPNAKQRRLDRLALLTYKLLTGEIAAKHAQRRPSLLEHEIARRAEEKRAMDWSGIFTRPARPEDVPQ